MKTLELVLWLTNGRHFYTLEQPDIGLVPCCYRMTSFIKLCLTTAQVAYQPEERPTLVDLTFELTAPAPVARHEYTLGRRRFHYREPTGWLPPDQLRERDLYRDRDARFHRIMTAVDKHHALMEVGAFPIHSCALPADWPDRKLIAAHLYGFHNLGLE